MAEVTTRIRAIPQEVSLGRAEGVPQRRVANLDNLHVVAKAALGERIGRVSPRREREAKSALGHVLAWPELVAL